MASGNRSAPPASWSSTPERYQSHSERPIPGNRSAPPASWSSTPERYQSHSEHAPRRNAPRSTPNPLRVTRYPTSHPPPPPLPPPHVRPQQMNLLRQLPGSDSEDENGENDISLAPFDIGSGALAGDSKLKVSRQKANLEAKMNETETAIDAQSLPDLSLHANEGKTTYNAMTSYYIMEDGSDSSADISTHIEYLANLPSSRRRDRSVFRWIHMKQENMDFDIFVRCAREMPGLPEDQVQSVTQFLQRVRKEFERTIRSQRGTMGNFMKAGLISKRSSSENSDGGPDRRYVFCCIPYHQLAPYAPLGAAGNSKLHPMRTLLQSKYPSTTKQRDLEQAVRFLDGTPANHVFHTSNLWCLIVNNKFMITSASGLSAQQISGDRTKLVQSIPTQPSNTSILPQSIQILLSNRLYILPLSQCDSWFKLTQNFSAYTLTLHDQYTMRWKGAKITAELWPLIVHQAQKEIICISLSPRKRPITHGLEESLEEVEGDEFTPRPHTPNDDRLSVISEVDSIRSMSSGKISERGRDSSPLDTPTQSHKQSSDFLQSPSRSNGKPSPQATRSSSPTPGIVNLREFYVLVWIALCLGRSQPPASEPELKTKNPQLKIEETRPKSDRELVNVYLNSVHSWLENQKNKKAASLYCKSIQKSLDDVEKAMQGMLRSRLDSQDVEASKRNLVESVKSIYSLFLPMEHRNTMCSKLWGALHTAITAAIPDEISWQLNATVTVLAQVAELANTIKAQLSGGNAPPPEALSMPPDALRVWHQLLLCLLFWSPRDMSLSHSCAGRALALLGKAHKELMKNPKAKKLEKVEAVLPDGLLAFMISHIVSDFTGTQPGLVDSYWEYFDQLELKVDKEPLARHNQAKITAFISEIKIVLDSLEQQQIVVDRVDDEFDRNKEGNGRYREIINPRDPAQLVLQEALYGLRGKITSIEELLGSSQELLEINAEAIRHNKDKQEAAIYIFTIVTIVFLPISTVASVFGMNTNDIRNMDKNQWLFWATALPLTTVVIVFSLFAAGILTWPFKRGGDQSATRIVIEPARRRRRRRRSRRDGRGSSDSDSPSLVDD